MELWGKRFTIVGVILTVLSVAPIMLYASFGPPDGNPIGLGLLMVFGGSLFAGISVLGVVLWGIGFALRLKRNREKNTI